MPLTDSYGQGISYPTLTDKPNAQTLGQGIVESVVPKLVMTFASAIVRGATIKTPQMGMVTWLKDVRRLEVYDGNGWSTVTAGSSSWKTFSLNTGFAHNGNNQGSFQYRVVNLFGETGVMFRGGVTPTYSGNDFVYTNELTSVGLPVGARPSSLRSLLVPCSDVNSARVALKMDIATDGVCMIWGIQADTKPPWIGFNGVFCSL